MKRTPKRTGDLAINEDFGYQQKEWVVQRIAWCGFALILLAALLGLFGHGAFSRRRISSADGSMVLDYQRFLQRHSPDSITLRMRHLGQGETLAVWIANSYLTNINLEVIVPNPNSTRAEEGRSTFIFSVPKTNTGILIKFNLEPEAPGRLIGLIGVESGPELSFRQFVYP